MADDDERHGSDGGSPPFDAFLFLWLSQLFGFAVYFVLSRFVPVLPYTACIFIVGIILGAAYQPGSSDRLAESEGTWLRLEGDFILLLVLPGLIFWDAINLNWWLFIRAMGQIVFMAYNLVLGSALLVGLVVYYLLPYGWNLWLCMALGAILSATDLAAASSVLNDLGAPPRLKLHISGESLINDGSSIVFYMLFSELFLNSVSQDLGSTYTVGEGFAMFFRMSLGGVAFGLAFALALILALYMLSHYLVEVENIVQVTMTITTAYLCYYAADVAGTSGAVAVVILGVTTKAFGAHFINKPQLMESFWHLVEFILNTFLFTLGGLEFGNILTSPDYSPAARDWGYLIVLYLMMMLIRFVLFYASYPIISRIGLGSSWKETTYIGYLGLRGAIGLALCISLEQNVEAAISRGFVTDEDVVLTIRKWTRELFFLVGGAACLTLLINGTLAGYVLKKLGLAKLTEERSQIVSRFENIIGEEAFSIMTDLFSQARFSLVDCAYVKKNVPFLEGVDSEAIKNELREKKDMREREHDGESPPQAEADRVSTLSLEGVDLAAVEHGTEGKDDTGRQERDSETQPQGSDTFDFEDCSSHIDGDSKNLVIELRYAFLDLLHAAYEEQVQLGELDPRENGGFLVHTLNQSLEFASEVISNGGPLQDWSAVENEFEDIASRPYFALRRIAFHGFRGGLNLCCSQGKEGETSYPLARTEIYKAFAFIQAHLHAQERFEANFGDADTCRHPVAWVIRESEAQVALAEKYLISFDPRWVIALTSTIFCKIVLHRLIAYVDGLVDAGLLKEKEANGLHKKMLHALKRIENTSTSSASGDVLNQNYTAHVGCVNMEEGDADSLACRHLFDDMEAEAAWHRHDRASFKRNISSGTCDV